MDIVNIPVLKAVIRLSFLCTITYCHSSASKLENTYNPGGYMLKMQHNGSDELVTISGYVKDASTKMAIGQANLKIGCYTIFSNEDGAFSFRLKPTDEIIFVSCTHIGYRQVETRFLKLRKKDELTVNFFLAEDDRPINNCEGQVPR